MKNKGFAYKKGAINKKAQVANENKGGLEAYSGLNA